MPYMRIIAVLFGLLAMRYPIVNHFVGWMIAFPIVAVSAGSITRGILIQRSDALFSLKGYAAALTVCSVPVAVWNARLNR